ncbi:MAG: tRNA (adenosine(37)-N6)-threonylcarbamoyltransferase complex ATPase subunit type 1 TsaE [Acidobacteria bacterium]|jgi:tRNA threonylcarbamoyladenosine biosynthesis protein TsaE|nr:tRNA (adenosine(37)-N6)-threonylcarbamoyltransferase complex ATPase subunit type 1 TsaE [Acidobacteriota bacterium]
MVGEYVCATPEETFDLGEKLGQTLTGGEMILLAGGLGAGKTLFTKGILYALDFDIDEVTSPSFTLVNLYKTRRFDVYHIDLWRLDENSDVAFAVGLNEILEDETAVVIIEWSERLKNFSFPEKTISVEIQGDGYERRQLRITNFKLRIEENSSDIRNS